MWKVIPIRNKFAAMFDDGKRYDQYRDAELKVDRLQKKRDLRMSVPRVLDLCCKLINQRAVAEFLGTQGFQVKRWVLEEVECRKSIKDIEALLDATAEYYKDFPPIVEYLGSITINDKATFVRKPPRQSLTKLQALGLENTR